MKTKMLGCALVLLVIASVGEAQQIRNAVPDVARPLPLSSLHGGGIYYESGDRLWINLYVPSTVTFTTEERANRSFEILVDGQRIGEGTIERYPPGSPTGRFYDLDYKIPAELVKDKQKVTVRLQSTGGNETPTVFGVRIVRADEK